MNYCFASDYMTSRHSTLPTLCVTRQHFSVASLFISFSILHFASLLKSFALLDLSSHFPRVSLPLISVLFLNCAWLFYSVPQQLCSLLLHCPAPRYTSPPSQSIAVHFYQLITIASTAKRASCNQMVSSTFY